ncbi:MAG: hypothetical protein ISN29_06270 [Gammaproteobacteria bacterium AqS3]|nr:hypothetical protein [Gammaproteobacteria bacterium AqS3]
MRPSALLVMGLLSAALLWGDAREDWHERLGAWVLQHGLQLVELRTEASSHGTLALVRLNLRIAGSWDDYMSLRRHLLQSEAPLRIERESVSADLDGVRAALVLAVATGE